MTDKALIGVIGAGWWASLNHIPLIKRHEMAEVVAICGTDVDALQKVSEEFDISQIFTDFRELAELPGLSGIVVSSPHIFHFEHAKDALQRGLHVIVEKPLTTSSETARELVNLAEQMSLSIIVPYGWNYNRMTDCARTWVLNGEIGLVSHIVLQMASPTEDLFDGRGLASAQNDLIPPDPSNWSSPERAGGYGWGQLSHALGLLFRVTNESPAEVFAKVRNSSANCDYYDALTVTMKSGMTAVISGAASNPAHIGFQLDLRIFGTKGVVLLDFERERVELHSGDGKSQHLDVTSGDGQYECETPVDTFISACLGKSYENKSSGAIGCRAVEVLDAMYRSARSGMCEAV